MYHIKIDGYIITAKPMNLNEIIANFGPVIQLESQGYRLIKVG